MGSENQWTIRSRTTPSFRHLLAQLPADVQRQAREAYRYFRNDPTHPGLQFKRVSQREPIYSVRVGRSYRAVGLWEGAEIRWVWIGSHAEYDKLLQRR